MLRCSFALGVLAAFAALAFVFLTQAEYRAAGLFGEPQRDGSLVHGPLFWLCCSIVLSAGLVVFLAAPDRPLTRDMETLVLWSAASGWIAWLPLTGGGLFYLLMSPGRWHLLPVLGLSVVVLSASVVVWVIGARRTRAAYRTRGR